MVLVSPEELEFDDIVLVVTLKKRYLSILMGRVTETDFVFDGRKHFIVWGSWQQKKVKASVKEIPSAGGTFFFDKSKQYFQVYKIGRWIKGEVKTKEGLARDLLEKVMLEVKTTGLVCISTLTQIERFLRGI